MLWNSRSIYDRNSILDNIAKRKASLHKHPPLHSRPVYLGRFFLGDFVISFLVWESFVSFDIIEVADSHFLQR